LGEKINQLNTRRIGIILLKLVLPLRIETTDNCTRELFSPCVSVMA